MKKVKREGVGMGLGDGYIVSGGRGSAGTWRGHLGRGREDLSHSSSG